MDRTNCKHCPASREIETKLHSIVFAFDPTDTDSYVIPVGKQALNPSHIFYRPCSGIWQSVWIEAAPMNYITDLSINAAASGQMNVTVSTSGNDSSNVEIAIYERVSSHHHQGMMYGSLMVYLGDRQRCSHTQHHCRLTNHPQC